MSPKISLLIYKREGGEDPSQKASCVLSINEGAAKEVESLTRIVWGWNTLY